MKYGIVFAPGDSVPYDRMRQMRDFIDEPMKRVWGRLGLSPETLREFRECCTDASKAVEFPMEFRSADELYRSLEEAGFEPLSVEPRGVFKRYADIIDIVRTLKNIGAAPPLRGAQGLGGGAMLRRAGRIYAKKYPAPDGAGVIATYETIFVAAKKAD